MPACLIVTLMEYINGYQDPASLFVILAEHMLPVFVASHNNYIHVALSHWCPLSAKKALYTMLHAHVGIGL
jgi:hypothetical protein